MTEPTEAWGDEPSERDADATIAKFEGISTGGRRWHDHWVLFPFKMVGGFIARNGKRIAITIAGFALILAGAVLLVLPGPGWLLIFAGLAVLATEYVWAQRMLNVAREKAQQAKDKVLRKKQADADPEAPADGAASGEPTT